MFENDFWHMTPVTKLSEAQAASPNFGSFFRFFQNFSQKLSEALSDQWSGLYYESISFQKVLDDQNRVIRSRVWPMRTNFPHPQNLKIYPCGWVEWHMCCFLRFFHIFSLFFLLLIEKGTFCESKTIFKIQINFGLLKLEGAKGGVTCQGGIFLKNAISPVLLHEKKLLIAQIKDNFISFRTTLKKSFIFAYSEFKILKRKKKIKKN